MWAARFIAAVIFFAILFGVRELAHGAVALGFIPWLALMIGIVWGTITIENRDRRAIGAAPYSWYDAGRDVREAVPVIKFWIVIVLAAFVLSRLI